MNAHADDIPPPSSWADLSSYAKNRGSHTPRRHPSIDAEYDVYKAWCVQQGLDNHTYVVKYHGFEEKPFALTPNIVPYHMEPGIWHWVLWHDPASVAGTTDLDPEEELRTICTLFGDSAPRADEIIVYQVRCY